MSKYRSLGKAAAAVAALFLSTIVSCQADGIILSGHVPAAVSRFHLQPVGSLPASQQLKLAIGLPLRNADALDQLLAELYDPASPNFHQYLTPEQFTERFGPTEQDYEAVMDFARRSHLTITATSANRVLLDVSGSVADIQQAFHVTLRTYQHPTENRLFYAPDVEPSVDSALPVADVSGLNNYELPHPKNLLVPRSGLQSVTPKGGSGPSGTYMGNDFRSAYAPGVSLTGSGQMVGLLEFDSYYANDITNYENDAGQTNVPLQNDLVDGVSGTPGYSGVNGAVDEVSLDIEMAVAMAPGLAKVVIFEGDSPNDILNAMVASNGVKNLSSSWGWSGGPSTTTDNIFKEFATQGQSFFNAAGDSDAFTTGASSANGVDNTSLDNAPSSSPYITQVGGTTLTTTGAGGSWSSETVWNWGDGTGTCGGISSYYSIPSWQTNVSMAANGGSRSYRNIPDVALTADNVYVIYNNGSAGDFGGTSCAAPLWAAFTALANQQAASVGKSSIGFLNPALYAIGAGAGYTADFHDITAGNNTSTDSPTNFYAVTGYDLCTGWGTPNGQNLINALAPADVLGISPLSGFAANGLLGGPFSGGSETFTLTNSGAASVNWSVIGTPSWLGFSPASGALASGQQTSVTANLAAAAYSLALGNYSAGVWFTNQTTGVAQLRQFTLQVLPPLAILPASGFTTTGLAGGPFSPASENFVVTNLGTGSLNWSVINGSSWLNVSPPSGTLPVDGQAAITASLTYGANFLSAGTYAANVLITNLSGGAATLPFTLQVNPLVQNGGFETGDFTDWTQSGNTAYTVVSDTSGYVHSGNYGALLGPTTLGYLSQTIPTTPGQHYLLSLWLDNPSNSKGATPNQFLVQWNGAAVFSQTNVPYIAWTNLQFVVTASSSSTVLQLGFYDNPYYLGLDDISVTPLPAFSLQTTAQAGSQLISQKSTSFNLTWSTVSGLAYQMQYKTNLMQTNWISLGKPQIATGSTLTLTDTNALSSSAQRFYRCQILY
jgi:hypothetical protein